MLHGGQPLSPVRRKKKVMFVKMALPDSSRNMMVLMAFATGM
jgi:hypothetical protein